MNSTGTVKMASNTGDRTPPPPYSLVQEGNVSVYDSGSGVIEYIFNIDANSDHAKVYVVLLPVQAEHDAAFTESEAIYHCWVPRPRKSLTRLYRALGDV